MLDGDAARETTQYQRRIGTLVWYIQIEAVKRLTYESWALRTDNCQVRELLATPWYPACMSAKQHWKRISVAKVRGYTHKSDRVNELRYGRYANCFKHSAATTVKFGNYWQRPGTQLACRESSIGKDSSAAAATLIRVIELINSNMAKCQLGIMATSTLSPLLMTFHEAHRHIRSMHDHQNTCSVTASLSRTNCTRYIFRQNHSLTGCRVQ